jgi:hypothetical protein
MRWLGRDDVHKSVLDHKVLEKTHVCLKSLSTLATITTTIQVADVLEHTQHITARHKWRAQGLALTQNLPCGDYTVARTISASAWLSNDYG